MAFTVGDFYKDLRALHKRGTSLDSELPGASRRAVRWIEQNYTLSYMRRQFYVDLARGALEIPLPELSIKSILALYLAYPERIELQREDLVNEPDPYGLLPSSYTQDGTSTLVLDRPVGEPVRALGTLVRFTDWPTVETGTHWLLTNAESLLRCCAMLELNVFLRDERSFSIFTSMRDMQIQVLQNADFEARYANQDLVMGG